MSIKHGGSVVLEGLVLYLDASNRRSSLVTEGKWADLSRYNHHGDLTSVNLTDRQTMQFGSGSRCTLGHQPALLPSSITQEAWVCTYTLPSWSGIITNMPSWGSGFGLQIGSAQRIGAMVRGSYLTTTWSPKANTWYHIAATHGASTSLNTLYVNGTVERTSIRAISYEDNAVVQVGAFYTASSGIRLDGEIGEVRTYQRALSLEEIRHNYLVKRHRYSILE